jgi:hypothetical protein
MRIQRPAYLTLMPKERSPLTEPEMYSWVFSHLADKVADAKHEARELMRQYLERGHAPEELCSDYTLMDLDLAYIQETDPEDHGEFDPVVVYVDPNDLE